MVVEFNNVSMTYKPGIHALINVTFRIEDGEFVFIIGRSGSGKSTLIKLLTCEESPTSGQVFIDDFEISNLRRSLVPFLRRNIGMIFQDFRLIQSKTVYQNVAFAMEIIGANNALIRKRVPMVLSVVGLRDKANMHPGQLSGGEQQRVSIARAMVNNPTLILADEPTGNLDPINSEAVIALLQDINDTGTTVVVCTHDATMVNKMKRRVIEISEGYLVRDDILGEYNLSEVKKSKKKKYSTSGNGQNKRKKIQLDNPKNQDCSPFVRNINIKFNEQGCGLLEEQCIIATADAQLHDTNTNASDIASVKTIDAAAVEYYMRKARKIHDNQEHGDGKQRFFDFNSESEQPIPSEKDEEPTKDLRDDFYLMKPKRVKEESETENAK